MGIEKCETHHRGYGSGEERAPHDDSNGARPLRQIRGVRCELLRSAHGSLAGAIRFADALTATAGVGSAPPRLSTYAANNFVRTGPKCSRCAGICPLRPFEMV